LGTLVAGAAITAVTGVLMVSRFAYISFKDVNPGKRVRFAQLVLIPLVIIVIALEPPITLFSLFVIYAASGPLAWLWRRRKRHDPATSPWK
jgi:CDP-diacylglycerol--serine O-phosphatidyltransferase